MSFYTVFEQIFVLFIILVAGYIVRKLEVFDDRMTKGLSSLLLKLALPALIIDSLQQTYSPQLLRESGLILLISFVVYGASGGVAAFFPGILRSEQGELGVFRFSLLFSNVGFMGYPVVLAIFGQEGLFYAAIYNLPFNLLVFTLGIVVMTLGRGDDKHSINWRMFVSPAVVSVLIGFSLFLLGLRLPGPIAQSVKMIGSLTTPLSMIIVGALLSSINAREIFSNWRIYAISTARLIFIPLLVWLSLRLFTDNVLLIGVPTIIAAMPAAANTAILAEEYSANPRLASQVVFISTLLSIITIPFVVYFIL
ncbi:MAG: auxin efflux carrier family protein [Bacillota bacterium]|nr:MAG: auxin efflux carrier family protein [Bacillota bacterium]MBS3950505.1 AEC family transporter [Peptococcaceae bacterium]